MTEHQQAAHLSPGAGKMIRHALEHLDGDPDAGIYLILTRCLLDGSIEIKGLGHNLRSDGLTGGARLAIQHALHDLATCRCGVDHAAKIAELAQVEALLSDDVSPTVHQ